MKQMFIILFLILFNLVNATIINIPAEHTTFYSAITASVNGDTILVQPGTYLENINYAGKNITIGSLYLTTQDTTYISQTILDGFQNGSVVTFVSGEDSTSVLCGLTITNGYAHGTYPYSYGGGVYIANSNPSLKNVTITGNSTDGSGGGIYFTYSNPSLDNVIISGNSASHKGGGIYCHFSSPNFKNVTITGNSALEQYGSGGGIYFANSNTSLDNVTISGNSAYWKGGGLYYGGSSDSEIANCILWNNLPLEIYVDSYNTIQISYSDIQGGESGIGGSGDDYWLIGNINSDPLFVDSLNNDFHLQWDSPLLTQGILI